MGRSTANHRVPVMCIAIPPPMGARRRRSNRAWRWLTARPSRLLGLAAVAEGLLLALVLATTPSPDGLPPELPWLVVLGLILPTATSGLLLERYPAWLRGEPPRYVRYGSLFHLLLWGSLLTAAGTFAGAWLVSVGTVLLLLGWLLGVKTLWHIYDWAPARQRGLERLMNLDLALGSLGLAAAGAGIVLHLPRALDAGLLLLLLTQAGMAGLLLARFLRERQQRPLQTG